MDTLGQIQAAIDEAYANGNLCAVKMTGEDGFEIVAIVGPAKGKVMSSMLNLLEASGPAETVFYEDEAGK